MFYYPPKRDYNKIPFELLAAPPHHSSLRLCSETAAGWGETDTSVQRAEEEIELSPVIPQI